MENELIDTIYPYLKLNTEIELKEWLIINAVIRVIRYGAKQIKNPDEMPLYFSINREQLASLSSLSIDQIKNYLRRKKTSKILATSKQHKVKWKNGYCIDFDRVKSFNEMANSQIVYEDPNNNRFTMHQLISNIWVDAKTKMNKGNKRLKQEQASADFLTLF